MSIMSGRNAFSSWTEGAVLGMQPMSNLPCDIGDVPQRTGRRALKWRHEHVVRHLHDIRRRGHTVNRMERQMTVHTFEPTLFHTTLGSHAPVLRIRDGDTVSTWCVDAGGHDREFKPITAGGNPQTGPFYVEGAEPGDTLAVHFDRMWPNRKVGFTQGVTAYLPVFVEGALLHFGDGHAVQGDGEIVGTGIEISFDVTFTVQLLKGKTINWPRGENADSIFAVGNARPLDQCVQHATTELMRWLDADYGLDFRSSSVLLGQCIRYDLGNVFDPAYTMVARMEKRFLPLKNSR
jgi:acetamidase/formamidase